MFNIDVTMCPLCEGTLRIIAEITDPDVIQKILHHMRGPPRAQAPLLESATARQSRDIVCSTGQNPLPDQQTRLVIAPSVCRLAGHWPLRH